MQNKIQTTIAHLEQTKDIHVLYACESGSRAWGIPSPDSDFDVRFIYVHNQDWYLSLCNQKDTITIGDDELDLTGWDLRKALLLLKKSNAAPLEWMHSPIVYKSTKGFTRNFRSIGDDCLNLNAINYHYLSMAKKFYDHCAGEESVKLKTWFYAMRAALNCKWVVQEQSLPPILFKDTLALVEPVLAKEISALIALKGTKEEGFLFEKVDSLLELIKDCIDLGEANKMTLPGSKVNMHEMNRFFRKNIQSGVKVKMKV